MDEFANPRKISRAGLRAKALRKAVSTLNAFSVGRCALIAAFTLASGTVCAGIGWWLSLPARLPGDEAFNFERAAGLTFRGLIGFMQPADAPLSSVVVTVGGFVDLAALTILLVGVVLWFSRQTIDLALTRHARDLRLLIVDAGAVVPLEREPTGFCNVFLDNGSRSSPHAVALHVPFTAATAPDMLPHLALHAREVLALGADASRNIAFVRQILSQRRAVKAQRPLERLWLRIDSRELRRALGRDDYLDYAEVAAEVRLTSLPEARCRRLLRNHPPSKVRVLSGTPVIVVVGAGDTGLELLARLCTQAQSPYYEMVHLLIIDTEAPAIVHELRSLWPTLSMVVEFHALALEPRLPQSALSLLRHLQHTNLVPACIYVALEDPALCDAWESEICLAVRVVGSSSPLIFNMNDVAGDDLSLLKEEEYIDELPKTLHANYANEFGHPVDSATPWRWPHVPFDFEEDNRSLADHLWAKARDLDWHLGPEGAKDSPELAENETDRMAKAEHRRWVANRALAGWRHGKVRSTTERTHPCLVSWNALPMEEQLKDRHVVEHLAQVLRSAKVSLTRLVSFALPRSGVSEDDAEYLIAEARERAKGQEGLAHLVIAVENAASLKLALRLSNSPGVVISTVAAQPIRGLALAAGLSVADAAHLEACAHACWISSPGSLEQTLNRWPRLERTA